MRTFLVSLCFLCGVCTLHSPLSAQALPAPVLTNWYYGPILEWLHVVGARGYEVDVASDSTFSNILPGLNKYQGFGYLQCARELVSIDDVSIIRYDPLSSRYSTGATLRTFFFQLPRGYPYYVRMRAFNAQGMSTNSNTFVIPSLENEIKFRDVFAVRTNSRQAYIPTKYLRKGMEYDVTLFQFVDRFVPFLSPPEKGAVLPWCRYGADIVGVPPIKTNLSEKDTSFTLPTGTDWVMVVLTEKGAGASSKPLYALVQPFSQQLEPYISRIDAPQFYEMLQPERIFGTPEANLFYSKPDSVSVPNRLLTPFDSSFTHKNIDSLVLEMVKIGLPIDTVWFQAATEHCTINSCGLGPRIPFFLKRSNLGLVIKLRQHDDRIYRFGAWDRGYPFWSMNDLGTPRRYVMKQQQMMSVASSIALPASSPALRVAPNPASENLTVDFTLTSKARVTIELCDMLGRIVTVLEAEEYSADRHTRTISLAASVQGVYRLRLGIRTEQGTSYQSALVSVLR